MTIGGWIIFGLFSITAIVIGVWAACDADTVPAKVLSILISIVLILALLGGLLFYFNGTASGQRALTDQKSELQNGLDRVINVYTADGDLLAHYEGKIDISDADGYVKFDMDGKRYIYYNCYVESIADID